MDVLHELATRTVVEARKVAEETRRRLTAEAEADVRAAIAEAEERAHRLVEDARQAAERLIESAGREADRLRSDAAERADTLARRLLSDSRKSADKIMSDAIDIAQGILRDADTHEPTSRRATPRAADTVVADSTPKGLPAIKWGPVLGASKYDVYITEPPHGKEHVVYESGDIEGTTLTIPVELKADVSYKWSVRAGNANGWGPFAPARDLVV